MLLGCLALLAASVLAGCGDSHETATSTPVTVNVSAGTTTKASKPKPNRHAAAQRYLRIVGPTNAAHTQFLAKARAYGATTPKGQVVADLAPVIAAYRNADTALLRVKWPRSIRADVKTQVAADRALIRTLEAAESQNAKTVSAWFLQVSADWGTATDAESEVRTDLGLRPYSP